jgi:adenylate cyclase
MSATELKRRLAAIFAADVCGYSRLMAGDERATVAALDAARAVFRKHIESNGGRVVDTAGDSVLAVFDTATGSVAAAIAVQGDLLAAADTTHEERRMRVRIGVHLGEVMEKADGTVYGDGVNIAARLESLAEPGGITISAAVEGAIRGRVGASFADQGEQTVKNIPTAVHAYRWVAGRHTPFPALAGTVKTSNANRSIAVLPFDNLSNDPEQEYFADGIAEDLLTMLSKYPWLMVIARNSSFTYKGRAHDIRRVGSELGVRYVLEGSVRKSGNRVRISCQLIDASDGMHVWAERYDRDFAEIFDLQDEITLTIAGAIEPELGKAERERALRKPVDSLDAWDLYQRGLWHLWKYTRETNAEAKRLFTAAIELDPQFAPAHSHLALCIFSSVFNSLGEPPQAIMLARDAALRALVIDQKEAVAHFVLGRISTQLGNHGAAIASLETAIQLSPSMAQAHYGLGNALTFSGHPELAIKKCETAERLSPHDPSMWAIQSTHALNLLLLGRLKEAEVMARAATLHPAATFWTYSTLASILGHLGRTEEARAAVSKLLELKPDYSEAFVAKMFPGVDPRITEVNFGGLYKAGLPRPSE